MSQEEWLALAMPTSPGVQMSETIYEQIVEIYLAMKRDVFLHPQYPVGGKVWGAAPDFVAIEFLEKTAWMVEVTRSRARLGDKIAQFNGEYEPRIRQQLIMERVIPEGAVSDWKIGFWAFVPEWDCARVRKLFQKAAIAHSRAEALENALSLSAWDRRFAKSIDEYAP